MDRKANGAPLNGKLNGALPNRKPDGARSNGKSNGGGSNGWLPGRKPVTFGVVGLGYWGPNLLRVLADSPDVEVRWICDLDEARITPFARRYPAARTTTEFQDLLDDDGLDAVVIATPVYTHVHLCTRSLMASKHTFVEKPLATSSESADDLVRLAEAQQRVIMCGQTFLYSPAVRAVKGLLSDGTLGDIFFISSSRVNLGLHQRDVSVVWDLGPHDFSILLDWLGELPAVVRATGRDSIVDGVIDVAFVTLEFPSGIVANIELSWLAPSKLRRTVVVGSERMVVYDDCANEPVRVFDSGVIYRDPQTFGEYHLSYRTGDVVSPKLDAYEPLSAELSDFTNAIASGSPMHRNARMARDIVRIAEAAEHSMLQNGIPVPLEANGPSGIRRSVATVGEVARI